MFNKIWVFIKSVLMKIWTFLTSKRDYMYILIIILISLLLFNQCEKNSQISKNVSVLRNNISAITDTLKQYKDENGRIIAEKHAFQLTEKELRDSVNLLKTKNREYVSYINTLVHVRDTIKIPTYIDRDIYIDTTKTYMDKGIIKFDKYDVFGKSNRELHVQIPYVFNSNLVTGDANVDISNNIFVESTIERDTRTGETYVRLMSDYPNLTFNSGMGVVVINSKSYEKSIRKTHGIGLGIGPSIGMGYDFVNNKIVPTVGISLTIGFTWTPKWAQW